MILRLTWFALTVAILARPAICFGSFVVSETAASPPAGKDILIGSMGFASDFFEYSNGAKVYAFAPGDSNPIKLFDKTMDTLVIHTWNANQPKPSMLLQDPLLGFVFAPTPKIILRMTFTLQAYPSYWSVSASEIYTAAITYKALVGSRSGYLYLLNEANGNSIVKLDPANTAGATVHTIPTQASGYYFASFSASTPKMILFSDLGNAARFDTTTAAPDIIFDFITPGTKVVYGLLDSTDESNTYLVQTTAADTTNTDHRLVNADLLNSLSGTPVYKHGPVALGAFTWRNRIINFGTYLYIGLWSLSSPTFKLYTRPDLIEAFSDSRSQTPNSYSLIGPEVSNSKSYYFGIAKIGGSPNTFQGISVDFDDCLQYITNGNCRKCAPGFYIDRSFNFECTDTILAGTGLVTTETNPTIDACALSAGRRDKGMSYYCCHTCRQRFEPDQSDGRALHLQLPLLPEA